MHFLSFLTKTGGLLPKEDIISSHAVHSHVECSHRCLQASTCVGFNYRPMSNKYAVNCQLSKKIKPIDQETGAKGEWTFYKDLETVRKTIWENYKNTNAPFTAKNVFFRPTHWVAYMQITKFCVWIYAPLQRMLMYWDNSFIFAQKIQRKQRAARNLR